MALPQDRLSNSAIISGFSGARALPVTGTVDFEDGGLAIRDTSKGLRYQIWRCRAIGARLMLSAPTVPEYALYSGSGQITEVSLSFDQSMQPAVAFVEAGVPKLLWFDTNTQQLIITLLPSNARTPRVALDDKREHQNGTNDVIVAYIRSGRLYYRQQRDQYGVERDPTEALPIVQRLIVRARIAASGGLIKIGMNNQLRLQFFFKYRGSV